MVLADHCGKSAVSVFLLYERKNMSHKLFGLLFCVILFGTAMGLYAQNSDPAAWKVGASGISLKTDMSLCNVD